MGIGGVYYWAALQAHKIAGEAVDTAVLEHVEVSRYHGREHSDHPWRDAILANLPDSLWAANPFDCGFIRSLPYYTFDTVPHDPVWRP